MHVCYNDIMKNIPYTIRFRYDGTVRVVINPAFKETAAGHNTVTGLEMRKGDEDTVTVKAYRLDRIEGSIETVAPLQ